MTDKLDAATIRELLVRVERDNLSWVAIETLVLIARYALELSDKVEQLGHEGEYLHTHLKITTESMIDAQRERDALRTQLQSQAAELERLRARQFHIESCRDCQSCEEGSQL